MSILIVLLVDIVVFYAVFISIRDTEKTTGTRTECRRAGRALGGRSIRYSCTYRYYVNGIEYNEEDIITHIKKVPAGTETEIYYKKDAPTRIITKFGIMHVMKILAVANIAALGFFVFMHIIVH